MDVPAQLEEDAFRAFFERHHAELARFAWLLIGESGTAEDIAPPKKPVRNKMKPRKAKVAKK